MKATTLLVVSVLLITSCDLNTNCLSKDSFVTGYEKFSNDIKEHYKELEQSDWVSIDREFKGYVEVCYPKFKEELSLGERVDFWKKTLSYGLYRGDNDSSYQLDIDLNLDEELDEISAQGRKEIERYIKEEISPDLKSTIDDVIKEVESLGNKLKEWLDEQ